MPTLDPLNSEHPLIAYFDIKSPYAYLAKDPTRALAAELGIQIDWRPFTLDIPSYLGSAKLDKKGAVAQQNRSDQQWSGIKYAYFDCRRYANLRDITVRGTVKIWNTRLVSIGMLWARAHGMEMVDRYLDVVYPPFWKRELDVEDPAVVAACLRAAGAPVAGFSEYAAGSGGQLHDELQESAFAAGIYGVPTYVVNGHRYFGREHLPRIRWHLTGERGPAPAVAYETASRVDPAQSLQIWIDFNSASSFAAIASIRAMLDRLAPAVRDRVTWHAVELPAAQQPPPAPASPAGEDRAGWHRVHRARLQDADLRRYAPHALFDPYSAQDPAAALAGLHLVQTLSPQHAGAFVQRMLSARFAGPDGLSAAAVAAALGELSVDAADLAGAIAAQRAQAERSAADFRALGFRSTPAFVLDEEPFLGAQHLPLIEARLAASR